MYGSDICTPCCSSRKNSPEIPPWCGLLQPSKPAHGGMGSGEFLGLLQQGVHMSLPSTKKCDTKFGVQGLGV